MPQTRGAIIFQLGRRFGYPDCCILDYICDVQHDRAPFQQRGRIFGRVPCRRCTAKIACTTTQRVVVWEVERGSKKPCRANARLIASAPDGPQDGIEESRPHSDCDCMACLPWTY